MGTVKKHGLNPEESLKLFNKFYMGSASAKTDLANCSGLSFHSASFGNGGNLAYSNSRSNDGSHAAKMGANSNENFGSMDPGVGSGTGYSTRARVSTGSWT